MLPLESSSNDLVVIKKLNLSLNVKFISYSLAAYMNLSEDLVILLLFADFS